MSQEPRLKALFRLRLAHFYGFLQLAKSGCVKGVAKHSAASDSASADGNRNCKDCVRRVPPVATCEAATDVKEVVA